MDSFRIIGTKSFRVTYEVNVDIEESGVGTGGDKMNSYAQVIFCYFS